MEGAELAERAVARREEVAHQVLHRAREEHADVRRALEDRAQLARHHAGVAEEPAGDLLELVEEDDQPLVVGGGDALEQLERRAQRAAGVLLGAARREGDLEVLAEVLAGAERRGDAQRVEQPPRRRPRALDRTGEDRPVGERLDAEGLGELGGVGDVEEIDGGRVAPRRATRRQRRVADAGLARPPRTGHDDVAAAGQRLGDGVHVVGAADHGLRADGEVGREQLGAPPALITHRGI